MRSRLIIPVIIALLTFFVGTDALAEFQVPPTPASNPVHDGPDVLTPAQEIQIGAQLVEFKSKYGIEVGVAIIPTLGDLPIKEAGYEIASAWALGDKERKDGLLLLVVADKAKAAGAGAKSCGCLRFEVGEYLEGDLTDIASKEILLQEALPLVTVGKYNEGIDGALKGVMVVLGGGSEAAAKYKSSADSGGTDEGTTIPWWVWVIGVVLLIILQALGVPILDIVFIFLSLGGRGGGGNSVGGDGSFGGGGGDV